MPRSVRNNEFDLSAERAVVRAHGRRFSRSCLTLSATSRPGIVPGIRNRIDCSCPAHDERAAGRTYGQCLDKTAPGWPNRACSEDSGGHQPEWRSRHAERQHADRAGSPRVRHRGRAGQGRRGGLHRLVRDGRRGFAFTRRYRQRLVPLRRSAPQHPPPRRPASPGVRAGSLLLGADRGPRRIHRRRGVLLARGHHRADQPHRDLVVHRGLRRAGHLCRLRPGVIPPVSGTDDPPGAPLPPEPPGGVQGHV